jgi:hypothetical protein
MDQLHQGVVTHLRLADLDALKQERLSLGVPPLPDQVIAQAGRNVGHCEPVRAKPTVQDTYVVRRAIFLAVVPQQLPQQRLFLVY